MRVDRTEYRHTTDKGKWTRSSAYALVDPAGKPVYVGLFVSEDKADEYIRQRGWKRVSPAA